MTRITKTLVLTTLMALLTVVLVEVSSPSVSATVPTPAQRVASDYNAAAVAGSKFQSQFVAEVPGYGGSISVETFASKLATQANSFVTPLEAEQEALLSLMLNTNVNSKTRIASGVLATTITKLVYVLGLSGFAAGGQTGLEGWASTFQSTKVLYQGQAKTVLSDLGYSVTP